MFKFIADYLIERAKRTPYFHLVGYMDRYWLVPTRLAMGSQSPNGCGWVKFYKRPIAFLFQCLDIAIKIHIIKRSDEDTAYHDHPWWSISVVLRGGYLDVQPLYDDSGIYIGTSGRWYDPGSIIFRSAKTRHRLELPVGYVMKKSPKRNGFVHCEMVEVEEPATTLFITGPRVRHWGFYPNPKDKIPYEEWFEISKVQKERSES